jgi:hypothetical protein
MSTNKVEDVKTLLRVNQRTSVMKKDLQVGLVILRNSIISYTTQSACDDAINEARCDVQSERTTEGKQSIDQAPASDVGEVARDREKMTQFPRAKHIILGDFDHKTVDREHDKLFPQRPLVGKTIKKKQAEPNPDEGMDEIVCPGQKTHDTCQE